MNNASHAYPPSTDSLTHATHLPPMAGVEEGNCAASAIPTATVAAAAPLLPSSSSKADVPRAPAAAPI